MIRSMSKITRFDRSNVNEIHREFNEVVKAFAAKYGLEFEAGSGSYGDYDFNLRCTLKCVDSTGYSPAEVAAADSLLREIHRADKPTHLLGSHWIIDGTEYECIGYKPSSRTYPLIMRKVRSGAEYKFRGTVLDTAVFVK